MLLKELCGWHVSDERIRQACYAEAKAIATWRTSEDPAVTQPFREAVGAPEFQTDATKVNTKEGWRDMKIGVLARRKPGASAEADDWTQRELPRPTVRLAFAAIEDIDTFALRWGDWAERLGLPAFDQLSVIADGAEWIWNAAADQFPGHRGCLDIFHASEHLHATAAVLHGEGTDDAHAWHDAARNALLRDGWYGLSEHVGHTLTKPVPDAGRTALEAMVAYFVKHSTRLNYCLRLRQGLAIGSGQIEGACKQMIGRRMKQTGAQWTVKNANHMAELCSLSYSGQWNQYWMAA